MSELVKGMLEEDNEEEKVIEIPLPNVKSAVLRKVIEFCQHYQEEPMVEFKKPLKSGQMAEVVQKWYADFAVADEQVLLSDLILAANYMDIKPLMDLTGAAIAACMIRGEITDEIRAIGAKMFSPVDPYENVI
ncbi:hypothetical protein ACHAW5_003152 [Stephanodiscus triporus]|uniref:SKP1 component POZ domain-containing protein n=1 Tax=Stephanodiscus triporus TaxID=2934178 RepID=A0ABD3NQT4_9STRA